MQNPFRRGLWAAIERLGEEAETRARLAIEAQAQIRSDARSYTDAVRESLAAGIRELAVRVEVAEAGLNRAESSRSGLASAIRALDERLAKVEGAVGMEREDADNGDGSVLARIEGLYSDINSHSESIEVFEERLTALETRPRSSRARKRQEAKA